MAQRQRLTQAEREAEAQMAQRHQEEMDEKGLCHSCSDRPQNPFVNASMCLECYQNNPMGRCVSDGCLESAEARYEQMALCPVHMADILHDEYERYLELRDELHEKEKELGFLIVKRDYDTIQKPEEIQEIDNPPEEVEKLNTRIKLLERNLNILKSQIKKADEEIGGVFPDNYDIEW